MRKGGPVVKVIDLLITVRRKVQDLRPLWSIGTTRWNWEIYIYNQTFWKVVYVVKSINLHSPNYYYHLGEELNMAKIS